jgi:hypothetical protein
MSGGVLGPVLLDPHAARRKRVTGKSRLEIRCSMKPPVREIALLSWTGRTA